MSKNDGVMVPAYEPALVAGLKNGPPRSSMATTMCLVMRVRPFPPVIPRHQVLHLNQPNTAPSCPEICITSASVAISVEC